jgi:hypothetical protein
VTVGALPRPPRPVIAELIPVVAFVLFGCVAVASAINPEFFAEEVGVTPASALLAVVLIAFASRCGPDPFHPARLLAALLGLSFVIGPIVHAATGRYILPDGPARQAADLPSADWIVLAAAVPSFLLMKTILGASWASPFHLDRLQPINRRSLKPAIVVVAIGTVLLLAYFVLTGITSVSLSGRGSSYTVIPHEGRRAYLALLAPLGLGGLLVAVTYGLDRRSRIIFVTGATASVLFGAAMAVPGSRANLLYAVTPLVLLYAAHRGVPRPLWLAAGTGVVLLLLFYGASLRDAQTRARFAHDPWAGVAENRPRPARLEGFFLTDIAHTEPLLAAMDAYPATRPFLGGESVALGLTGPPGWKFMQAIGLRADPPVGVTSTATAYGRDPSTFGAGVTATLPGELYANAGVLGVLVGLPVFAALAAASRRRALSSTRSCSVLVYAVQMTVLFAIFADYIGQFYRAGVVLLGVLLSLIAGGERFAFGRALGFVSILVSAAAALLVVHRFVGAPPASALTSMIPAYLTLAGSAVLLARQFVRGELLDKLASTPQVLSPRGPARDR